MTRLLHAAARGARVEVDWLGDWVPTETVPTHHSKGHSPRRIHPDDLHLQYGPISTALRKQAEADKDAPAGIPYIHGYFDFTEAEYAIYLYDKKFDRAFFLLLLAEALADEGL